jgi:hypothetical protein
MADLNANIILGAQQFDLMGAMDRGLQMANNQNALSRQREIEALYRSQGNALMQGDQNALAQLAQFDPSAAMGLQGQKLDMQATQQRMAFGAEEMAMRREQSRRDAEAELSAKAATLTAEQLAAEQEMLSAALQGGAFYYQNKDKAGYDAFLKSKGIDPAAFPFEGFPAHAASVEGVLDAMKAFAPAEGPEWRPATPDEAAARGATAGQISDKTGEFKKTSLDSGMVIETGPNGTTIRQGPGATNGTGEMTVGQAYNPNEIANVVGLIDQLAGNEALGIPQDPGLDVVTGKRAIALGGGNMINEMNMAQRIGYGEGGLATIERIGQLQSNAWLSARSMLKGGGAITDYESKKAEAAVARLERPKSKEDFVAALKELRDAITEGEAKLRASQGGATPALAATKGPTVVDGFTIEAIE